MKLQLTIDTDDVSYEVEIAESKIPVHGNVMQSGDHVWDREAEESVISALEAGNTYAWCDITIRAKVAGFVGFGSLTGCCAWDKGEAMSIAKEHELAGAALTDLIDVIKGAGGIEL